MKRFLLGMMICLACSTLLPAARGQSVAGKWVGQWRVLDNGEKDRMFLDLHQDKDQMTGTIKTIGHVWQVHGTVTGSHFDVFFSPRDAKPRMTGAVGEGKLHLSREGTEFDAVPSTSPADDYADYKRESLPPGTHGVPANGLARTPPMGWNSWNLFQSHIDDKTVRQAADLMVSSGMRDAGYVYVNIDDTWQGVRDANGNLSANSKFPDMKALADYIHSKGLKFGIYSSPGPRTCAEYPGSYGHEEQDAKTFAAWGVDYLKYDWCGARMIYSNTEERPLYQKMGAALQRADHPIVYSLCQYGVDKVETWGATVGGNLWRTTGDISDTWNSMVSNIEKQVPTAPFAGPGHWNDPDMLEIGNGGMTDTEYRTHMTLWAITAAPLLAGNDLSKMTLAIKSILLNSEVIKVDQDSLGKQAVPVKHGSVEAWVKPLANGDMAVAVVNLGANEAKATVKDTDLGMPGKVKSARDLWSHTEVALHEGSYTADIPSHGAIMLRVAVTN